MPLIYLLTLCAFSSLAYYSAKRNGFLYFPVYFFAYIAFFHAFIPFIILSDLGPLSRIQFGSGQMQDLQQNSLAHLFFLYTAGLTFAVGWWLGGRTPTPILDARRKGSRDVPEGKRAIQLAWAFLGIGALGFFLYFHAFGGVVPAMSVAREFRTGFYTINNPWSFMRPVGDLVQIATLLFLACLLAGARRPNLYAGLAVSLLLSFLMLFFRGGRLSLALFVSILILMLAFHRGLSARVIALAIGAMLLLLYFGYPVLYFVYEYFSGVQRPLPQGSAELTFLEFLVKEMSFPYASVTIAMTAIKEGAIALRYGIDVLLGLVSIVPARLYNPGIPDIGSLHTGLSGALYATIPVDIITYGVYSLGILGPMVVAFFVGLTAKYISRFIAGITWPVMRYAITLIVLLSIARSLAYFNPASAINSLYMIAIGTVIVYLFSRKDSASRRRRTIRPYVFAR